MPIAFAPVVVKAYPGTCRDPLPQWIVRLPPEQVDAAIAAGRDALRASPVLRGFLAGP